MAWDTAQDLAQLAAALESFEQAQARSSLQAARDAHARSPAEDLCRRLAGRLVAGDEPYPARAAASLVATLRGHRQFDLAARIADAFIQTGTDDVRMRRLYAHCLLELGHHTAAKLLLESLLAETEGSDAAEHAEARGLLGRLYKQLYVDAAAPGAARGQRWLEQAAAGYLAPYLAAPERNLWHGINVVAVADRSIRDGVTLEVPGLPMPRSLAAQILRRVEALQADGTAGRWDLAIAIEAALALGRSGDALAWARHYTADARGDDFEFAGTLRQLEQVWQLPRRGGEQQRRDEEAILSLLRATILERPHGHLLADAQAVRSELGELRATDLQKVFGAARFQSLDWYRRGLMRCATVARIGRETSKGVGTGFLVRGGALHERLGDELLLLTNAHVISQNPEVPIAMVPDEAVVTFEGLEAARGQTWRLRGVVYSSPVGEYDATLLRLDRPVPGAEPPPVAARLPPRGAAAGEEPRVYVVGHPLGGGLSFSLQDNALLDWDERRVHYRTPTEPGSSGSPVFNDQWELVALHHAGRADMRRLNGQPGTYEANEGIGIAAIRAGLERALAC